MFGDKLQQKDGVTIRLECGHPNVKHDEICSLCGNRVIDKDWVAQHEPDRLA